MPETVRAISGYQSFHRLRDYARLPSTLGFRCYHLDSLPSRTGLIQTRTVHVISQLALIVLQLRPQKTAFPVWAESSSEHPTGTNAVGQSRAYVAFD